MKRAVWRSPWSRAPRIFTLGTCAAALLCACGPDALTAATSNASAAAAAAKQAKEQKAQLDAQIKAMQDADQKRVEGVANEVDRASQ